MPERGAALAVAELRVALGCAPILPSGKRGGLVEGKLLKTRHFLRIGNAMLQDEHGMTELFYFSR